MKLVGGGVGVVGRRNAFPALVLLIGVLLDGCLALKCYKCSDDQDVFDNCNNGQVPTSKDEDQQQVTQECVGEGEACGFSKAIQDGKVLKVVMGCVTILDIGCSNGKRLKMSGTCHKNTAADRKENQKNCHDTPSPVEVADWNGYGRMASGKRSGNDMEGTSGGNASARASLVTVDAADWDFCTCTTDLCNNNCTCVGGDGSGGGSGGASESGGGSEGGSGSGSLFPALQGGILMITTLGMAMMI